MKLDLTPSLPPEVSVVGNASQSTLELLNELVKQGAVVIQNATLMQNVTVNHSNISVASANCSQTITTHCMGNNTEEVERTVCAGGHDVSSTNQTRCEPQPSEWSSFEVPAAPENTIRIIPNMEDAALWPPFSWSVCRKQKRKTATSVRARASRSKSGHCRRDAEASTHIAPSSPLHTPPPLRHSISHVLLSIPTITEFSMNFVIRSKSPSLTSHKHPTTIGHRFNA